MHRADRSGQLQDRRVSSLTERQGLPDRIRATFLQRQDERRSLQAPHWSDAPDQSSSAVPRYVKKEELLPVAEGLRGGSPGDADLLNKQRTVSVNEIAVRSVDR